MFSRVNVYFSQFLAMFHIFLTRSSERCVSGGHFGTLVSRVGFICWELDFFQHPGFTPVVFRWTVSYSTSYMEVVSVYHLLYVEHDEENESCCT